MRACLTDYQLVAPVDWREALQRVADGWRPLAGGTDLMVLLNAGKLPYKKLVNIADLKELTAIDVSADHVSIGAAVTYAAIMRNDVLRSEFPLLCQAASWTGAAANQNRGTLGGNIVNASPAADSPPALLVYGAELELVSRQGERRVPYQSFHHGYKQMDLRQGELVRAIRLPRALPKLFGYARKVGARKAQAISKVCLAALGAVNGGRISQIKIAVGSVAPIPLRCLRTEASLLGRAPSPDLAEEIIREIQPIDDIRSTALYRTSVARNLLAEFLGKLL